MIADWLTSLGLGAAKPALAALVLPPASLLALAFAGALLARSRPRTGPWLAGVACAAAWLASCTGAAHWAENHWLDEPPALDAAQRGALRVRAAAGAPIAIVVLGGGLTGPAPEYGEYNLASPSLGRLRYAIWLARQTGLPIAASGGRGWSRPDPAAPPEAALMAEIAQADWGMPLRWTETASHDTHENAIDTLALLRPAGIRELVVVTHGLHMPRALREFRAAAVASAGSAPAAASVAITAAPMGQPGRDGFNLLDWFPSGEGALRMHEVLHEVLAGIGDAR
ncbi:MAG: YdcF family protein [Caulobacter sp.]|nr:YdcF family protein [Vitreoscilla sp.]